MTGASKASAAGQASSAPARGDRDGASDDSAGQDAAGPVTGAGQEADAPDEDPAPKESRAARARRRLLPPALAAVTVVGLWLLLSQLVDLVPGPARTLDEVAKLVVSGDFFVHMWASLRRVIVGFVIAMVASMIVGIVMGTSRIGEAYFRPLVIIGLTVPGLIWALVSVMLFGLSEITTYFAVTVTIFPMLVITIWGSVRSMDRDLIDMSTVLRLSRWTKIRAVILPQLLSAIFSSTRYGLGLAWKIVVVVELFGASDGVGHQINRAYQVFNLALVLAWTALFVVVMMLIEHAVLNPIEKRLTAWRPEVNVWRR